MLHYQRQPRYPVNHFAMGTPPPPDVTLPPIVAQEIGRPQRLLFAAMAAYWVVAAVPPADEPAAFGYQDTQVRQPLRAERSAYAINVGAVAPDEINAANGHQTHEVRAAKRAPESAYWLSQRPTAQFDSGIPAAQGYQDQTPRTPPRAPPQGYFIEPRPIWLELGQPASFGHQDQTPRQPPRADRTAYSFVNRLPDDNQPASWGHQTEQARAASRAQSTAYWVDHVSGIEGPDPPASQGSQANNVRGIPRAASDAYRLIAPMALDEPETTTGYLEQRPLAALRAPGSAYWIEPRAAVDHPERPVAFGWIADQAPAAIRSASAAYDILQGVPVIEVPASTGYFETASLPAARAKVDAYWLEQRSQAPEFGIPAQFGYITDAAPAARRAAPTAYAIAASVPPADEPTPGRPLLPESVRLVARADADTYFRQTVGQIADPMPESRGFIEERAPGVRRATADAYQMLLAPQTADEQLIRGFVTDRVYVAPRAVAEAYWIDGSTLILGADEPAAWGHVTERTPAAQRASQSAYAALLSPMAHEEPTVFGDQSQPVPPLRAASDAYWINVSVPPAESPPAFGYIEQITRAHQRPSSAAHWLPQSQLVFGSDQPAAWGYQEQRHLRMLRPARDAYVVNVQFAQPEIIRTGPLTQIYGSSSQLRQLYGSDSSRVAVYGEGDDLKNIRGAT